MPPNFRIFRPPRPVVPDEVSNDQVPAPITDPDVAMRDSEIDITPGEDPVASQLNVITNDITPGNDPVPSQLNVIMNDSTIPEDRNVDASNLVITTDNSDIKPSVDKTVEVQPPEAIGNQTPSQAPPTSKKSKRVQEDGNVQWLGDKVITTNLAGASRVS